MSKPLSRVRTSWSTKKKGAIVKGIEKRKGMGLNYCSPKGLAPGLCHHLEALSTLATDEKKRRRGQSKEGE